MRILDGHSDERQEEQTPVKAAALHVTAGRSAALKGGLKGIVKRALDGIRKRV